MNDLQKLSWDEASGSKLVPHLPPGATRLVKHLHSFSTMHAHLSISRSLDMTCEAVNLKITNSYVHAVVVAAAAAMVEPLLSLGIL